MNRIDKIIVRSFNSKIPAQFAQITLTELGIDSSVKSRTLSRSSNSRYILMVDARDASLAKEILSQAEQYECLLLKHRPGKKRKNTLFQKIAELLKFPN